MQVASPLLPDTTTDDLCGKWMNRAETTCARKPGNKGECRTAKARADTRASKTERRVGGMIDPEARSRWSRKHRRSRYSISQKQFDWLLEAQDYACAMCHGPFGEGVICIDHDHACCPDEKKSCGQCVRGLLCLSCNTSLGHIERKL